MALADAICSIFGSPLTLREFVASPDSRDLQVLEINPAGSLNPTLRRLRGHRLVEYPEADMLKMPYETATFDLIVHSDTLDTYLIRLRLWGWRKPVLHDPHHSGSDVPRP
jgi:hypothetical protein